MYKLCISTNEIKDLLLQFLINVYELVSEIASVVTFHFAPFYM